MPNPTADPAPADAASAEPILQHAAVVPARTLDRFAIMLSGLCLVHCLAVPLALFMSPFIGGWLIESETTVHWLLLALAVPASVIALGRGYARHRSQLTLLLGVAGIISMFFGVSHLYGESAEAWLTSTGVSVLLVAHVRNVMHLSAASPPTANADEHTPPLVSRSDR